MAELLKVNGRDLSTYMNLQQDSGLDPVDADRVDPQFSGALALGEGQGWVMDAVGNRVLEVPLVLKSSTVDGLFQLVRNINGDLGQGAQVEYQPDGATNSTFFDLERGRLDVQYQYFLQRKGYARARLTLWCRPHGHTGTTRLLASQQATVNASGGPQMLTIPTVAGDLPALAEWFIRMGNDTTLVTNRVAAFGVHAHPSFVGVFPAASTTAEVTASLVGNNRAIGSQHRQYQVNPTAAGQLVAQAYLNPDVYYGRFRVLVPVGHTLQPATALRVIAKHGVGFGAVGAMSATIGYFSGTGMASGQFHLADLGEINIPSQPSGLPKLATQTLEFYYGVPSGVVASAVGSYPLRLGGVVLLPLDHGAGMVVAPESELDARAEVRAYSWPRAEVVRTEGSPLVRDLAARLRGGVPQLPPTPSYPLRAVVVGGSVDEFHGTDEMIASVSVRERFQFFR